MSLAKKAGKWAPEAKICDAIHRGSFAEALDEAERVVRVRAGSAQCGGGLIAKVDDARADLRLMYKSLVDGVVSADLDGLYDHMRQRLYSLADSIRLAAASLDPQAPARFRSLGRPGAINADIPALVADYRQEALLGSDGLDPVDSLCLALDGQVIAEHEARIVFSSVVTDGGLPEGQRAFVIGVLAHSLISLHNRAVAMELTRMLADGGLEPAIMGRAAAALAADMTQWPLRWADDPALLADLDSLARGGGQGAEILRQAIAGIAMQRLVPTVEHLLEVEMRDEMNSIAQKIIKQKPDGGTINISEEDTEEIFGLKGKKILGNLAKIEEWKRKGVDIGYVSMKHMKADAFFSSNGGINNVRPFDPFNSAVSESLSAFEPQLRDEIVRLVSKSRLLPDSDKYSIIFSMRGINAAAAQGYCKALSMNESTPDGQEVADGGTAEAARAAGFLVKDLYRGVRLRPGDFPADIFDSQCGFFSSGVHTHLFDSGQLATLALSLVESRSWPEAQAAYSILCAQDGTNAANLRKHAYCLLKTDDSQAALEQLRKADIVDDSDVWTKRMIAELCMGCGQYAQAAYALEQARRISPADLRLATLSARCSETLRHYDLALKDWREVAYARPDDPEATAGVARCLIMTGGRDDAARALSQCPEGVEADKALALLLVAELKFAEAKAALARLAKSIGAAAAADTLCQAADSMAQYGVTRSHVMLLADAVRGGDPQDGPTTEDK